MRFSAILRRIARHTPHNCRPDWPLRLYSVRRQRVSTESAFDYAIIRVVPNVERQEFINAGVVLFCKSRRFLGIAS